MFIIFMAHMPGNWFTLYIPARFGFSDATEIFVFCSGMASAIAFGKIFENIGWLMGAMRIAHRMWQVYWAHIGLFFTVMLLMIVQNKMAASGSLCFFEGSRLCLNPDGTPSWDYIGRLNIIHLFQEINGSPAWDNFLGIMTLTWVPNLFDILPMYIVILAMIPLVMGIKKLAGKWAAISFVIVVWLATQDGLMQMLGFSSGLHLPAEPWSDREWFFNPFGWQLVFFTGFAFMMGWLPKPPVRKDLIIACIAVVLIIVPFAFWGIYRNDSFAFFFDAYQKENGRVVHTLFQQFRESYWPWMEKVNFGILRYAHFLALAYVFWVLAGDGGKRLDFQNFIGRIFVKVVHKVGQQSLATFMAGIVFSRFAGFLLDTFGKSWPKMILINLAGMAAMVAVAYLVSWIKKTPWRISSKPMEVKEPARVTGI